MKYYLSLLIISLLTYPSFAQKTIRMSAIKTNDYGVAYTLPKTAIIITVHYTKSEYKKGEYYQYAKNFLNISNPITENKVTYTINKIVSNTIGIPDRNKSYLVEFKPGNSSPFVTLTKDNLICAINDDFKIPADTRKTEDQKSQPLPNPKNFLSEDILRAGSEMKQAELIAKQIYRLRDSHNDILTGDADNMPPDGNAYKLVINQLEVQEKALTSMFIGTKIDETFTKDFVIIPPNNRSIDDQVIFRFSSKLGILNKKNLAGSPIILSVINENPQPNETINEKQKEFLAKKFSKGIVFNIPSKARLTVSNDSQILINKECDIVQYGTQDVLISKLFENNKKPIRIIFYPELGAIRQIIQ